MPALITESEIVGDDWLIDDVHGSKRKRPDMDSLLKDVNVRAEKKRSRQQPSCSGRMPETSRARQSELHTSVDSRDNSFVDQIFDSESASPESTVMIDEVPTNSRELLTSGTAVPRKKQLRLSASGRIVAGQTSAVKNKAESGGQSVTSTTTVKPPAAPVPNPLKMRLKVRIGDQLILVPVLERFVASQLQYL